MTCGCLVSVTSAKEVRDYRTAADWRYGDPVLLYYCLRCAPPYEEVRRNEKGETRYFSRKRREVTAEGVVIG